MSSGKDMAIRVMNAEDNFISSIVELGNLSKYDAMAVFRLYKKEKLVKLEAGIGRYSVRHGALLDKDTLKRAARVAHDNGI